MDVSRFKIILHLRLTSEIILQRFYGILHYPVNKMWSTYEYKTKNAQ